MKTFKNLNYVAGVCEPGSGARKPVLGSCLHEPGAGVLEWGRLKRTHMNQGSSHKNLVLHNCRMGLFFAMGAANLDVGCVVGSFGETGNKNLFFY